MLDIKCVLRFMIIALWLLRVARASFEFFLSSRPRVVETLLVFAVLFVLFDGERIKFLAEHDQSEIRGGR